MASTHPPRSIAMSRILKLATNGASFLASDTTYRKRHRKRLRRPSSTYPGVPELFNAICQKRPRGNIRPASFKNCIPPKRSSPLRALPLPPPSSSTSSCPSRKAARSLRDHPGRSALRRRTEGRFPLEQPGEEQRRPDGRQHRGDPGSRQCRRVLFRYCFAEKFKRLDTVSSSEFHAYTAADLVLPKRETAG